MSGASRLIPLPSFLALALAAAHFWRAGWASLATACVLAALLAWTRLAWVRQFLLLGLPLLAARWIWTTGQFVQIRQLMEQPWQRLAAILLSVALLTVLAALLLLGQKAQQRYCRREDTAAAQLGAMSVCLALLLPAWFMNPQLLLLERFIPQGGWCRSRWPPCGPHWRRAGLATGAWRHRPACGSGGCFLWCFSGSLCSDWQWKAVFCSRAVFTCPFPA
ncbi:hypothetical protein [Desulfovibrio sp. G11]|uniref:hypothetical protein n=1 Tax=Desulfovibrio sp. G11 TaxID=631220 RepID=UPI001E42C179|nr:hypothetical protein [Desulfovibrio sp. G11]